MASAPIAGGGDEGRIKQRYSECKVYRRKTFKGVKSQNTASATASITVSTTTTDKDPSNRNGKTISDTFSNVKDLNNNSDQAVPHSEASEDANLSQQEPLPNAASDADDLTRLDGQTSVGPTTEATQDPPSVNGISSMGFDDHNRVNCASKPKQEMQELRRKFESELEIVRNLVKRIEAIQGQINSGHSHSHVSTMDIADNGRGAYHVHSEVGSVGVPTDDSRPLRQLSTSVLENGKGVHDFMEREKRTPKANQFYRNSEFLLAKDKIPPAESYKKSKLNGKKHSRRKFKHGFGTGSKIFNACVSLLEKLMKHKHGWVFNTPVDVEGLCLHDYYIIIRHPMDLGTVKTRLNKNWYKSPKEFAEDVRLTFHNAMTYNPRGQDVHIMAEQLLKIFEDRWVVIESNYYQELRLGMEFGATRSSNSIKSHPITVPPLDMRKILRRSESLINPADSKTQPMSVTPSARTPSLQKPKAKDLFKRDMTYNEKKKLSTNLQNLPSEKLDAILQIIKKRNFELLQQEDEIEVDIDTVDTETLWELDRLVTNYRKSLSKNKRKAELAILKARAEAEHNGQEKIPALDGSKLLRETRADENILSSSSPIRGGQQRDHSSKSSSSSSSSSDSGSSSSDSDSDSSSGSGSDSGSPTH
ncbi:transcription factor GTE4-like [Cucurbita maxima]|uniref:Transcription factor GTE4-like n=1 Tax=Cucurbita maxima TaxID=3661 RepID=A0A6J1J9L8_CUCMA|nr:transcription factor GTE4-like [Cucurbita maxima]XP_022985931.1 transcription factor GTE4-like [Cucurbita maxima]